MSTSSGSISTSEIKGLPRIAYGLRNMLYRAICDHARDHRGARPKRFELHPEVICEFMQTMTTAEQMAGHIGTGLEFLGIPIIADVLAERPKLITCTNEVEYL